MTYHVEDIGDGLGKSGNSLRVVLGQIEQELQSLRES